MFEHIEKFETALAEFTGAPYAITTDCCTHAIELCLLHDKIKYCEFTAYTYLSVPMTMHKINVNYTLTDTKWSGEYNFINTRIWDSARRLEPNMYKTGQLQCLSFGFSKPLDIGRGGAILLDDESTYKKLKAMRYDGRDLSITPWHKQKEFTIGYHYKLNPEECQKGLKELKLYIEKNNFKIKEVEYPDCRNITIK